MGKYLTNLETDFISKSVDLKRENLTLLDIGAEAGRFSLLKTNNAAIVSLDIDSYSLKRLKLKNKTANPVLADARKLPFKPNVFDVAFMIEVLDYIPEVGDALSECERVLKPAGSCFLSFGNKSSLKANLRALHRRSYRHSYREVLRCLSKTAFKVKKKTGYSWLPFGRTSGSSFVPVFAGMERFFGLRRLPRFSPWVMMHLTKPSL